MSLCIAVFVHTVMKFSISGWRMMVVEGYTPRSIGRCCVTTLFPFSKIVLHLQNVVNPSCLWIF